MRRDKKGGKGLSEWHDKKMGREETCWAGGRRRRTRRRAEGTIEKWKQGRLKLQNEAKKERKKEKGEV